MPKWVATIGDCPAWHEWSASRVLRQALFSGRIAEQRRSGGSSPCSSVERPRVRSWSCFPSLRSPRSFRDGSSAAASLTPISSGRCPTPTSSRYSTGPVRSVSASTLGMRSSRRTASASTRPFWSGPTGRCWANTARFICRAPVSHAAASAISSSRSAISSMATSGFPPFARPAGATLSSA